VWKPKKKKKWNKGRIAQEPGVFLKWADRPRLVEEGEVVFGDIHWLGKKRVKGPEKQKIGRMRPQHPQSGGTKKTRAKMISRPRERGGEIIITGGD